jgi:subtilisin family serine protease
MPWLDNVAWDDAIEASELIAIGTALPGADGSRASTEVLYRPGEMLIDASVYDDQSHPVRQRLDDNGAQLLSGHPRDDRDARRAAVAERLDLRLLLVAGRNPIGLLAESRGSDPEAESLSVHHVPIANPQRHGGYAPPRPVIPTAAIPGTAALEGANVRIAVLDTGLVDPAPAGFVVERREPDDFEVLDAPVPGPYGPAVGHGTLVAGVIATYAPRATLVIRRVLHTPLGDADELEIAEALDALPGVDIINASFGGFAVADDTMLGFAAAVDRLPDRTLIVASVGNEGVDRPVYMAAFERVVGVASVERPDHGSLRLADYSNRGDWVKLCAEGTDVESTFITGNAIGSGTSFAAPKVTAAAAAMVARLGIDPRDAAAALVNDASKPWIPKAGRFVDPLGVP